MSTLQDTNVELDWRQKLRAMYRVAKFKPKLASAVVCFSIVAAVLEGFGLSFILPIVELAQAGGINPGETDGLLGLFFSIYSILGIPFTMGYLVLGVVTIMTVRFTSSFLVGWFRGAIETQYVRHLQQEAFNNALNAEIGYFDTEGSDDILNAIVTQAEYAGRVIRYALQTVEQAMLSLMYVAIALYLAPVLTVVTAALLASVAVLFRNVLEGGYSLGDEVADAKEGIQENAQAGTQGIRDVKLFGLAGELREGFTKSVEQFERSRIKLLRNESAITNFYQLVTAVSVFVLIYAALTFSSLELGALGVFLFAMFRLGPKVSNLNRLVYRVEGELPHLVRTQAFVAELSANREPSEGEKPLSGRIDTIAFDDVRFSYDEENEPVLRGVDFAVDRGEFVAFVGPSGAGKSTIISLLARMYTPDEGTISADGTPHTEVGIEEWRSRVSVVRQDPHIFNDTLKRNVTIGNRSVSRDELETACEIAQITEFVDDLPNGYETVLGDQGVMLSGGQRQRVAIARALLKDADLLVLDEATSDLDTSLERRVHEGIEGMERDYAMLVIAHRLSTVTNADRIYTMEKGQVVESGTHAELLSNNGVYGELYNIQYS
ncbi:multidrug ABC transporter permease [Haloprofundus marisrubri]|uniref:Multidrug ABC transporter permease n=1 Tax=Haloprofundus marisrubri TaxID=1514971 RepID=A0A0W1R7D2_9EURY|nr:ABC transporter ATP-binding protein [Haloprofundus marisrubri]KTG09031.1 multidrug ABC transporter permease [Haloprofundus marisrubri]